MKQTGVRSGEQNLAPCHSRRSNDPAEVIKETPLFFAARRVKRVEIGIPTTGIDHTIDYCRRRLKSDLIVNLWVFAAVKSPFLFSCRRIKRIKIAVPAPAKQNTVRVSRRSVYDIVGFKFPSQFSTSGIERVDIFIPASKVDFPIRNHRTG